MARPVASVSASCVTWPTYQVASREFEDAPGGSSFLQLSDASAGALSIVVIKTETRREVSDLRGKEPRRQGSGSSGRKKSRFVQETLTHVRWGVLAGFC